MDFRPTPEQQDAITIIDRDLAVTAGAGSGKTRVLVERYLNLLNQGIEIHEIAAITFTKKAAQEMKDRIRAAVPEQTEAVEGAQISTIHSLCQRIIEEHPLEARIDPRFRVGEEWETEALLLQVIEEVLDDLDPGEEFGTLDAMVQLVQGLYNQMMSKGDDCFQREIGFREEYDSELTLLLNAVEDFLTLKGSPSLTDRQAEIIDELSSEWPSLKMNLLSMVDSLQLETLDILDDYWSGIRGKLRSIVQEIKDHTDTVRQCIQEVQGGRIIKTLGAILERVDVGYKQAKNSLGILDFNDLERLACELLANPEVRKDYAFRHVMVDEFQDTNRIQKEIVNYLTADAILFVVGDPKQSIYRFRGAEVEVFLQTQEEIAETGKNIFLKHNFRSRPEILEFTNAFFQKLMAEDPIGYEASASHRKRKNKPCVNILTTPAQGMNLTDSRELEAQQIGQEIRALVDQGLYKYEDISILFRTMTNVRVYEKALQAAQIPYVNLSGRGFFTRQEIQDILYYFAWLLDEEDEASRLAVLRSPFYLVSDEGLYWDKYEPRKMPSHDQKAAAKAAADREYLAKLMMYAPAPHVITEMLERTQYLDTTWRLLFGEQKTANVTKLVQQSWDLYARGYVSVHDQMRYINLVMKAAHQEGEAQLDAEHADVVVLRTIHGAKGLEFPVVFVADTNGRVVRSQSDLVLYHPEFGLTYKGMAQYEELKKVVKEEEISEAKRLLYVAITRAEEEVYLCGLDDLSRTQQDTWWTWIQEILPEIPSNLYTQIPGTKEWTLDRTREEQDETEPFSVQTYEPLPPKYTQVTFSVTALMTYARCPRHYYYRYILGIPERVSIPTYGDKPKHTISPLERGNIVHRVCEQIVNPDELEHLVQSAALMEGVHLSQGEQRDLVRIIAPYLESDFFKRIQSARSRIHREMDFALPVGPFVINGTVDHVFVDDAGLEIVDFKSNWIRPEEVQTEGAKYQWQLMAYAWAMEKVFQKKVVKAQAYFLIPNMLYDQPSHTLKSSEIEGWIVEFCEAIMAGEQIGLEAFPEGNDCAQCIHLTYCGKSGVFGQNTQEIHGFA